MWVKTKEDLVNYLDDYLFAVILREWCNGQIQQFLDLCELIKFPVSLEKMTWAETWVIFLGLLIDTANRRVCIPREKITKGLELINTVLNNKKNKVTVLQIQRICGFLNFLGRAVVPGCAFTRHLYVITADRFVGLDKQRLKLKQHHHVKISAENKLNVAVFP